MALDKEFLASVFESATEEQIEKVLKEYAGETTGLKANRDALLTENKGYKEKLEKFNKDREAEKNALQKQIESLEEKIKSSGTEEAKLFYEAEKKKIQDMYAAKLSESDGKIAQLEGAHNELRGKYLKNLVSVELEKAISESNVKPNMRVHLHKIFLAENLFEPTVVDGEERLLNKEYKTVKDALSAYLSTAEGKEFLIANSTGGGATGAGKPKAFTDNPFKTKNYTEMMRIIKENPDLAASMEAQAKSSK